MESISERHQDVKLRHAYSSIYSHYVFIRSVDPTIASSPHLSTQHWTIGLQQAGYNNVKLLYCKLTAWALRFLTIYFTHS